MNEIEIKDVQNVAQNMIVGSKQHSLFKTVINNNPPLVSNKSSVPEYGEAEPAGEEGLEISQMSINVGNKSFEAVAVTGIKPGCCSDGGVGMGANLTGGITNAAPKGLNSQLYGMLKPCSKQFNVGQQEEPHEDNQNY